MGDMTLFAVVFCGIFGLVGGIFLAIGIFERKESRKRLERCSSQTWAVVTDIAEHRDREGKRYYHPVYEYTVGEQKFVEESPYGSLSAKVEPGQNILIHFNPYDFRDFYTDGDEAPQFLSKMFIRVGAGALAVAVVAAVLMVVFTINI